MEWISGATAFYLFVQGLGLLAMAIDIWGTSLTNDRKLVLTIAASSLVFALHFALLWAPAGAASELMTTVRSVAAAHWPNPFVGSGFIVAYLVMGYGMANPFAGHSVFEMLPFVASIAGTFGMFWCKGIRLRRAFVLGESCWLAYSIHAGSIGGSILYAILIVGTIRTIFALMKKDALVIPAVLDEE